MLIYDMNKIEELIRSANPDKIQEIINRLDPDKIKCQICKGWFDNTPSRKNKFKPNQFLCCACEDHTDHNNYLKRKELYDKWKR